MNTAISNFYTSIVNAFSRPKEKTVEPIGKYFLASQVSYVIMEAILENDLELIHTDNYFAHYQGFPNIDIRIWHTDRHFGVNYYTLEMFDHRHVEVAEDNLNDLIIAEISIP